MCGLFIHVFKIWYPNIILGEWLVYNIDNGINASILSNRAPVKTIHHEYKNLKSTSLGKL